MLTSDRPGDRCALDPAYGDRAGTVTKTRILWHDKWQRNRERSSVSGADSGRCSIHQHVSNGRGPCLRSLRDNCSDCLRGCSTTSCRFLIDARNLGSLGGAVEGYVSKYSFTDDRRLQAMWTSLTSDAIQYAAFWARYKTHVNRRNSAAHRGLDEDGQQMTKAKAEDSIEVAGLFLAHIKDVLTKNGLAHLA